MNVKDFDECYKKLMDFWPRSYALIHGSEKFINQALSALLYSRIGERVSKEDFESGIENLITTGGHSEPSDIIRAINEVVNSRARKESKKESDKVCQHCLNTGLVSAVDRDNYGYAFRCPDKCKQLSEKIPLWNTKFLREGFRLVVVGGRLAIHSV